MIGDLRAGDACLMRSVQCYEGRVCSNMFIVYIEVLRKELRRYISGVSITRHQYGILDETTLHDRRPAVKYSTFRDDAVYPRLYFIPAKSAVAAAYHKKKTALTREN